MGLKQNFDFVEIFRDNFEIEDLEREREITVLEFGGITRRNVQGKAG
jgi:hypothetical protein